VFKNETELTEIELRREKYLKKEALKFLQEETSENPSKKDGKAPSKYENSEEKG